MPRTTPSNTSCSVKTRPRGIMRSRSLTGEEHRAQEVAAFEQVLRGPLETHVPAFHEHRAVGNRERDVHGLLDDDHRDALGLQALDDTEELLDHERSEAERELVDEQQL